MEYFQKFLTLSVYRNFWTFLYLCNPLDMSLKINLHSIRSGIQIFLMICAFTSFLFHASLLASVQMALNVFGFCSQAVCAPTCTCRRSGLEIRHGPGAQGDLITDICSACRCKSQPVSIKIRLMPWSHGSC